MGASPDPPAEQPSPDPALIDADWNQEAIRLVNRIADEEAGHQATPNPTSWAERPRPNLRRAWKRARRQAIHRLTAHRRVRAPRRRSTRPRRPAARRVTSTRAGPDDPEPAEPECLEHVWPDDERFTERLHIYLGRAHEVRTRLRRSCELAPRPELGDQP